MNSPSLTAPSPSVAPGSVRAWVLACRPATLTAAVAPVLVGTAIAHQLGHVRIGPAIATFLGASLLQIGSNFANDVFDYEKGADTAERLGPTRAVQAGLVSPAAMKRALFVVFGLALVLGVYLTAVAGPAIVVIGLASILSAIAYTGGPFPLGYHGLGDLFVLIFFGFVAVAGTTFVHLGVVPEWSLVAGLGVGLVAANILVVNNLRDRHTDVQAGKRTLAVRFGRKFAELQYLISYVVAYAVPGVALALGWAGWPVLLPLVTIPLALKNLGHVRRDEGRALNATLVRTAKLVFFYGATLAIGIFLGTAVSGGAA